MREIKLVEEHSTPLDEIRPRLQELRVAFGRLGDCKVEGDRLELRIEQLPAAGLVTEIVLSESQVTAKAMVPLVITPFRRKITEIMNDSVAYLIEGGEKPWDDVSE